jgi:hypothetical protein
VFELVLLMLKNVDALAKELLSKKQKARHYHHCGGFHYMVRHIYSRDVCSLDTTMYFNGIQ